MAANFHESFREGEVELPSERSTAIVFVLATLLIALFWRENVLVVRSCIAIAALLLVLAFLRPQTLRPLTVAWHRFGLLLHKVMNPLVMLAIFSLVFVPAGVLMRLKHDPLRSRRAATAASYWIDCRGEGRTRTSMARLF